MRKIGLIAVIILIGHSNSFGQVYKSNLGLRLGDPYRMGPTINYQFGLSPHSRLSINVGGMGQFSSDYKSFFGTFSTYYQHVWNIKGGLNWFVGAGFTYGYGYLNSPQFSLNTHSFGFGPQIGLEYDFNVHNIPLLLSVDMRPTFGYSSNGPNAPFFSNKLGLSLRYTFGDKK